MAKINHSNFYDVVDNIFTRAKDKGIMHINSEEEIFNGKSIIIKGKRYVNFGTCGYLGLEKHPLLLEDAQELLNKYGTQFSVSRAYVRPPYIQELEELVSQVFGNNKVIVYTSTSTVHQSVIGAIIHPDDLIVLDQQVHYSVQYPCQFAKLKGTQVEMIRHSNYEMLENLLIEKSNNYNRIWYMADGVYSMHGDLPDLTRLKELMIKYPKLHLYFDDAHGVGWKGKNGSGTIFDEMGVSERIILVSTLAKGFGCVGGVAVFGDEEMHRKVDVYGGILSYTHPLSPANVGAAIASAKIHLSDEIDTYQNELRELIIYMNKKLSDKNLTNTSSSQTPIYFIGCGSSKVTHNLIDRILKEGLYVNTATFPVVPNDKSGLRFTLTRHNTKSDIDLLSDALAHHLPLAIKEEGSDVESVFRTFNIPYASNDHVVDNKTSDLRLESYETINDISVDEWDKALANRGNTSHRGMQCIEEIFSGNEEKENNWSFHYPLIKDKNGQLICTTFFVSAWAKDDVLALENVSKKIEKIRNQDPYYLCSKTLTMGSMFTEGDFLFIDTDHEQWREAICLLFDYIEKIKTETKSTTVFIGDFEDGHVMNTILEKEGYAMMKLPNRNVLKNEFWENTDDLLKQIKSRKRRDNIKKDALRHQDKFKVSYKTQLSPKECEQYFTLFTNVKNNNFAFNFFTYPSKITSVLSKYDEWEFIDIKLKDGDEPIACIWCYVGSNHYSPLIMGLNYDYLASHQLYKQAVFQMVKRGNDLRKGINYLGFSADFEKQKYGAQGIATFAYMKVDDTFNLEKIESLSNV